MENSVLKKLSQEIRTQIFQDLFHAAGVCSDSGEIELVVQLSQEARYTYSQSDRTPQQIKIMRNAIKGVPALSAHPLAITKACRKLRAESLHALFLNSAITVNTDFVSNGLGSLLKSLDIFATWLQERSESTKNVKHLAFQDEEGCVFQVGEDFEDIAWWTALNLSTGRFKALLPLLQTPVCVRLDQSMVHWALKEVCDSHFPLEYTLEDPLHVFMRSRPAELRLSVEDKVEAHAQVAEYCNNMPSAVWQKVQELRDPATVESPGCCGNVEFINQLETLRRGYHGLIEGEVDEAPGDGYCCGRN